MCVRNVELSEEIQIFMSKTCKGEGAETLGCLQATNEQSSIIWMRV